jgi:hypothetical protein
VKSSYSSFEVLDGGLVFSVHMRRCGKSDPNNLMSRVGVSTGK